MQFQELIRVIPDFPTTGISFKDITTLLKDGPAFRQAVDCLAAQFAGQQIDLVAGPEARGFVIGAPVAYALGVGFVPIRKPGKLPATVLHHEYSLEYGVDALEVHRDAINPGQKVLIIDDLLATGGTTKAVISMVEQLGGEVVGLGFLIELLFLQGRTGLDSYKVKSLVQY
jgi:adenine phosphoribosyltransferase